MLGLFRVSLVSARFKVRVWVRKEGPKKRTGIGLSNLGLGFGVKIRLG